MTHYHAQHAKALVKPGKRDELIELLNQGIDVLKRTPGCISYLISTTEEPDAVWISELWTSKAAKDAVAASPESAQVMKELMPLVVAMTDRTAMTVVGGFGIQ
jgi:quinol monooxygenase YgiN